MSNEFGKYLKKLRIDRNESQTALAQAIGLTLNKVHKAESGKHCPDIEYLKSIDAHYNLSEDQHSELIKLWTRQFHRLEIAVSDLTEEQYGFLHRYLTDNNIPFEV